MIGLATLLPLFWFGQASPVKPDPLAPLKPIVGEWKSYASEYSLGGDLDKTASVFLANEGGTMAIRISTRMGEGKPYSPNELIVLHASADGATLRAYAFIEISDEPVSLKVEWEKGTLKLENPSIKLSRTASSQPGKIKKVGVSWKIQPNPFDRWECSSVTSYDQVSISQNLKFTRQPSSQAHTAQLVQPLFAAAGDRTVRIMP